MNIQARRISGSSFSAEDKLEVTFNSDNQPMSSVVHTIELVSGSNVTHGGGGQPNEYLHYKSVYRDAEEDGVIDYSDVEMALVQETQGTSVIKVIAKVITKAQIDTFNADGIAYQDRVDDVLNKGEEVVEEPPLPIEATVIKTGDITLEWGDDNFV
jgi:hypothetical protein